MGKERQPDGARVRPPAFVVIGGVYVNPLLIAAIELDQPAYKVEVLARELAYLQARATLPSWAGGRVPRIPKPRGPGEWRE